MTAPARDWDELHLSEDPAVQLLERLGYTHASPEQLEAERPSLHAVVLPGRLERALCRLNPWLTPENVQKAVRRLTNVEATSLLEANEKLHTALTLGFTIEQDVGGGRKAQSVRVIDFDEPANNDLLVTRQFRVKGAKRHVIPDVVVFVNGLPLAILECKSPKLGQQWLIEAVEQLERYQEAGHWTGLGAPKLFEPMQILVAACGQAAKYGTIGTPQRFFGDWKVPFPLSEAQLEKLVGRKPTPQDVLIAGLLSPANLLDVTRNFTAFEREGGKTLRKIPRYQQFRAITRAVERIKTAKRPTERGGVVWHTQGSGKSLTMLWLALKLRREPALENPTIVIVTDRTDLDGQIRDTFRNCGFPNPEQAESVKHLRQLLTAPPGKTILTTVQKFQDLSARGEKGAGKRAQVEVLNAAPNVFVLVDEAHRTQYKGLAANMRGMLKNACFLGFTGTPIDKKDRSTLKEFGPYIDTYTIEQAVADGATVPIFYESRLPELRILGQTLDKVFDRVFADRSDEERAAIKKKYATEAAIAAAPRRIEAIALDVIEHYTKHIEPGGFKAQLVAVSREAAVAYQDALERLNGPPSAVIMSTSNDDPPELARHRRSKEDRDALIVRFKEAADPLKMLVVCDMLLTGFDAPVEQVMYLDSPLREHTLLQAIARVNRKADKKDYGLVVDYWGVSAALQEALAIFSPSDVAGAMKPKDDELPRLQARHRDAMRFFAAGKDKADLDACVAVLAPEDVRGDFDSAFRAFASSMDMLLPDPRAIPYTRDLKWLGEIRQAARARYRDVKLDISDCGNKVRQLIDEAVVADGIRILVKEVSLFSKEFDEKLGALKTPAARASEMEHAIRNEIHVKLDEDPAFYESLRERLEKIVEDHKARRIDDAQRLERLDGLVKETRNREQMAVDAGLTGMAYAIYGLLDRDGPMKLGENPRPAYDEATKALATLIDEALEPHTSIVDWSRKEDVQRQMRRQVKRHLTAAKFTEEKVEELAARIVDLAKARSDE